jgi:multiple sugar transport system substrate-binding protein
VAVGAVLLGLLVVAACTEARPDEPTPSLTSSSTVKSVRLTFGVFGPAPEVAAYSELASAYHPAGADVSVDVVSWPDRDAAIRALLSGEQLPDVFMLSQRDLAGFTERQEIRPVDELLDERGVSFGDNYSRDALQAFADNNSLSCMPYSVSPMVIYYNSDLVDFDKMRRRGLDVPDQPTGWTFDQFTAAALFATRPGKNTRGVYIEPSLAGLSPFIYSGGGKVFDDNRSPTSLAFSDGATISALQKALTLLRDAQVTPTVRQISQTDPTTLFEQGRLGMIAGYRSLVPELRVAPGLNFDVMPMPSISRTATVGDVTGLCLSASTEDVSSAADFLVYVLDRESVARVVRAGYTVPANVTVSTSEAFLQPGREPANAAVFRTSVRHIQIPPLLDSWGRLEQAVAPTLRELVTVPLLDDATIQALTSEIDLESQIVLRPPSPSSPAVSSPASPSPS